LNETRVMNLFPFRNVAETRAGSKTNISQTVTRKLPEDYDHVKRRIDDNNTF
jgi:hypothetical protein